MTETLSNFLGIMFAVGMLLFVILTISEWILSMLWVPFYYRRGFEIYRKQAIIPEVTDISDGLKYLSKSLKIGVLKFQELEFHELEPNYYAIRVVLAFGWGFRRWQGGLMRQSIIFKPESGELTIVGYLNWSLVVWGASLIFAWIGGILQIKGGLIQVFFTAFIFSLLLLGILFLLAVFSYDGEIKINRLIETSLTLFLRKYSAFLFDNANRRHF